MKTILALSLVSLFGCSACGPKLKLNVQCSGMPFLSMDLVEGAQDVTVPFDGAEGDQLACHVEVYEAK